METTTLDLSKVQVFGCDFRRRMPVGHIDNVVRKIGADEPVEPVSVKRINDVTYELIGFSTDERSRYRNHSTVVAHHLTKTPLPVLVLIDEGRRAIEKSQVVTDVFDYMPELEDRY